MDWDEIRLCRSIFEHRGLRKAATHLGMSHATLRRRLESVEASLGVVLFDRRSDGLHPTPEALELLPLINRVAGDVATLQRRAAGLQPSLDGWIHVSLPDMLASDLLAAPMAALCLAHPTIRVRVHTTYDFADLTHREADLAVRVLPRGVQPDDELIGLLAGPLVAAVYGDSDRWIGWDGFESVVVDLPGQSSDPMGAYNNVYLQRALCREGSGLAFLPCFMADGLAPRTPAQHSADIWVLVHPDQRRNPRVRVFRDAIVSVLSAEASRLGPAPQND